MNLPANPPIRTYQLEHRTFRTPPPQLYDENNNIIHLSGAALVVLQSLLENRERVVSRDELLDVGWPTTNVEPNNLDQAVKALRKHIPAEHIIGVRASKPITSGGYRYVGPLEQIQQIQSPQEDLLAVIPEERHRKAWLSFARTIVSSYENRSPLEYPYAVRDPDVPLRATLGEKAEYHFEAVELIRKHLRPRTFTIVVGEYGAGKTYLVGNLAYRLAKDFVSNPGDGLLPVILPLRQTASLTALDSLLQSTLFTMYSVIFNPHAFVAAQRAGRLVLILDGLDEMIARTDHKDIFFHLSFLLQSPLFATTPIVLTTRPNVIPNISYYRRLGAACSIITLDPVDELDVKRYLRQLNLTHVLEGLETGSGAVMADLISRPLYIQMMIASEERIRTAGSFSSLTLNRLYEFYFQYWYERELFNIGRAPGDLPIETVRRILASVAQRISTTRKPYISEAVLQQIVQTHAEEHDTSVAHGLFVATKERLILVPDFAEEEVRFTFRHDSMRSYFYSTYIASLIKTNTLTNNDVAGLDPATVEFLFAIAATDATVAYSLSLLPATTATGETPQPKDVLAFLWHRKRNSELDPTTVTWLSTGDDNVRTIVARSLTGVTFPTSSIFTDMTLMSPTFRGSTLNRAKFNGGSVTGADFGMADLTGSEFARINLDDAKFHYARLNGSTFSDIVASGTQFLTASLQESSFARCAFTDVVFSSAMMLGTAIRSSTFVRVRFDGADLRTSHFDHCSFEGCLFTKALLTGATFEASCTFADTDLSEGIRA